MSVVPFTCDPYIKIWSGHVTKTECHTALGISSKHYMNPVLTFFLDYCEGESSISVWDGQTYDGALAAARSWADEGLPVRDQTHETRGRA